MKRYRRIIVLRREIKDTIHQHENIGEYSILTPDEVNILATAMPSDEGALRNIIGDGRAQLYGDLILQAIRVSLDGIGVPVISGLKRYIDKGKEEREREHPRANALDHNEKMKLFIHILKEYPIPPSPLSPPERGQGLPSPHKGDRDALTEVLSLNVLQHILFFLPPVVLRFASLTCSFWRHTIRSGGKGTTRREVMRSVNEAARQGYKSYLKHFHEYGCKLDAKTCANAAAGGNLECLKYLREEAGCAWDTKTCQKAAFGGHLEVLKYAHENGCPWDNTTCDSAAQCIYAHEQGCGWNALTCCNAAAGGYLDCLKYAHTQGCEWGIDDVNMISACDAAARGGHLECLKYSCAKGLRWGVKGRVDEEGLCESAASAGHLHCLRYYHENGLRWDMDICTRAASAGRLDCLRYIHEQGGQWDSETAANAASFGSLQCLKYLHENGCEWDERTVDGAIVCDQDECWKYAAINSCPVGSQSMWLVDTIVEEYLKVEEERGGEKRKRAEEGEKEEEEGESKRTRQSERQGEGEEEKEKEERGKGKA